MVTLLIFILFVVVYHRVPFWIFTIFIYINDVHYAIKHSKVHHFAGDTDLLNFSHSIKKMNKQVNYGLKNLNSWLSTNKICLNVMKTEVVLFKSLTKQTNSDSHLKLNGKQLYPTDLVKYLGIIIDNNLTWHYQMNNVVAKVNRANVMLPKIRDFVNFNTLKSIYHAIFESYSNYFLLGWARNANSI